MLSPYFSPRRQSLYIRINILLTIISYNNQNYYVILLLLFYLSISIVSYIILNKIIFYYFLNNIILTCVIFLFKVIIFNNAKAIKKKQMVHNDTINNEETLCNDSDHYFVNIFNLDHNEFNNGLPIDMKTEPKSWNLNNSCNRPHYLTDLSVRIFTNTSISISEMSPTLNQVIKQYYDHDKVDKLQLSEHFCTDNIELIHIIIIINNDIVGHVCFIILINDITNLSTIIITAIRLFDNKHVKKRNRIGSLLLTLTQEVCYAIHKKIYSITIRIKKITESMIGFLYANLFQRIIDSKNNVSYISTAPIVITSSIIFWKYCKKDNDTIPKIIKIIISFVIEEGWHQRRYRLNSKLSNVQFVLKYLLNDFDINKYRYCTINNLCITKKLYNTAPKTHDDVSVKHLDYLLKHIKTSKNNLDVYVPGLSVKDFGHYKKDIGICNNDDVTNLLVSSHTNVIDSVSNFEYDLLQNYNSLEGNLMFFNMSHGIFSDAKQYMKLRRILSYFYNVISNLDDDHQFFADDEENNLSQFLIEAVPKRLLEFYFNDNVTMTDKDTDDCLEKINYRIKNYCHEVFGVEIEPLNSLHGYIYRFTNIMTSGNIAHIKLLYKKLSYAILNEYFYGDFIDLSIIGKMFHVHFNVSRCFAKNNGNVISKKMGVKIRKKIYTQSYAFYFTNLGYDPDEDSLYFPDDIIVNNNKNFQHKFHLGLVDNDNHYVHFIDTNYDKRNKSIVEEIDSLLLLKKSEIFHSINFFIDLNHNHQSPIYLSDYDINFRQILLLGENKPIIIEEISFQSLEININGILFNHEMKYIGIIDNIRHHFGGKKYVDVMGVHVQNTIKQINGYNYTWDDVYLLFNMEPKKRKLTTYYIICPIDDTDIIKSCHTNKCNLILSTRHAFVDFRVDIGCKAFWYHIFKGQKLIILIRKTICNLEIYEKYLNNNANDNKSIIFFKEIMKHNPENIFCIYLRQGMTVIIPNDYTYAEYSTNDTIAFCGNFINDVEKDDYLSNDVPIDPCDSNEQDYYPSNDVEIYLGVLNEKKTIHHTIVIQYTKMIIHQMV